MHGKLKAEYSSFVYFFSKKQINLKSNSLCLLHTYSMCANDTRPKKIFFLSLILHHKSNFLAVGRLIICGLLVQTTLNSKWPFEHIKLCIKVVYFSAAVLLNI